MVSQSAGQSVRIAARWRLWVADAVWLAHSAITSFFCVAWAMPWDWALWAALLAAVALPVQWQLNRGICVLTTLERAIRGMEPPRPSGEPGCIDNAVARLAGRPLPQHWVHAASHAVLWISAAIAALRLADA